MYINQKIVFYLVLLYLFGFKDSGQVEGSTLFSLVCGDDIQQAVVVLSGVSWDMWLIWELEKEFIQLSFEKFQATVCEVADVVGIMLKSPGPKELMLLCRIVVKNCRVLIICGMKHNRPLRGLV